MTVLGNLKRKKQAPIYSIDPFVIKDKNELINYDLNNETYTIHAKPINSNIVQFVRFKEWKEVKNLFDKQSRKIIEKFIKSKEIKSLQKN
jgi:hypothetical protein